MSFAYIIMLGCAVSLDSIAAGVAYGLKDIYMPKNSLIVIGVTTGLFSAVAMLLAYSVGRFINTHLAITCGALLLILLGILNVLRELFTRKWIIRGTKNEPDTSGTIQDKIIFSIMLQPEKADLDRSKSISSMEAAALGVALGIDNAVATFGGCLSGYLPFYTPLIMGLIQMLFIKTGAFSAKKFTSPTLKQKVPYLAGTLLIVLGLSRLL